jgi:hypothetical protein
MVFICQLVLQKLAFLLNRFDKKGRKWEINEDTVMLQNLYLQSKNSEGNFI